ncbi:MAG: V-type ATP synthase subunit F [Thermoplasmata archaeon]
MRKKVVAVGKDDITLGFSLAGVDEAYNPENEYDAFKIVDRLVESPDIGVILISERIADGIRDKLNELVDRKDLYPVIVEIPDKRGPMKGKEDPLKSKIRRAVGIDITDKEEN